MSQFRTCKGTKTLKFANSTKIQYGKKKAVTMSKKKATFVDSNLEYGKKEI